MDAHRPGEPALVIVEGGRAPLSMGEIEVADFQIARHEVTWAEWTAVRDWATAHGYDDLTTTGAGCGDNHPVHGVTWFEAVKWCNARSEMEGFAPVYLRDGETYRSGDFIPSPDPSADGYRLPREAEWEFAARGGLQGRETKYSGSDDIDDVAWFWDNAYETDCELSHGRGTWPVGHKGPNELGLHDMSGNVWEWCWDAYGDFRHIRGGSWDPAYGSMASCAVSFRDYAHPAYRRHAIGFRVARNADGSPPPSQSDFGQKPSNSPEQ